MLTPIVREAPELASAHEVLGLAQYRLGNWRQAVVELEAFRSLSSGSTTHHAVLADCYRAMRKHAQVEELWDELRQASPSAALVAEGRIVMAGSLADRGQIDKAIEMLQQHDRMPARVRDHHLRLWYVLADLYDRNGDVTRARALFSRVRVQDPEFADVTDRLRNLGA
jgi:tetratricopeptide (TPR) repeat protein